MNLGAGTESAVVVDIAFWVIAVSIIVSAIAVVSLRDVFRAALFLVVAFLGTAGIFVLLRAEFLAVVQVIIYVGAISVLMLFAILMTQDAEQGSPPNRLRYPVGLLAFLFGAAAVFSVFKADWVQLQTQHVPQHLPIGGDTKASVELSPGTWDVINDVYGNTIPNIAELLLRDYVLAFEIVSVLLLAAIIGALVLVRER